MLDAAFTAGLTSEGADVVSLGVAPTPEVAWWSASEDAPAAMVSASHNPFPDNGIKLFSAGGRKLPDEAEARLESELRWLSAAGNGHDPLRPRPVGVDVGAVTTGPPHQGYAAAVTASIEGRRLDGLRVVLDCANGAASAVAPEVFRSLGAEVELLHCAPDGTNINHECGSTHPANLQVAVHRAGADAGVAFDGDNIIAICAIDLAARGLLAESTVVVTVMTNLGFRLGMAERGIKVVDTRVGDRYVLEALEAGGYTLGGEQSGHVIFRDLATTGDGLLTAVQALDVVLRSGRPLGMLSAEAMTRLPQVLRNVRVEGRVADEIVTALGAEIAAVEAELGPKGRVLVRASGTEPLVRVMAEAATEATAEAAVARLVAAAEALSAG